MWAGEVAGTDVSGVVGGAGAERRRLAARHAAGQRPGTAAARRRRTVTLVDDEVDRHFTLETADVAVAEVVTQLVYLQHTRAREHTFTRRTL